jgi:signal transduction histidine kinase
VRTSYGADIVPVEADPGDLEAVFAELIANAGEAMTEGGSLTVEIRAQGRCNVIRVEDEGQGMDQRTRARAFEPLFTTKGAGHAGLGLCTVFRAVRAYGGTIRLLTRAGRGTEVEVWLPVNGARTTSAAVPKS